MKSTGIIRNIDELGRLVVPKEMRTTLDINCNDPVEISMDGDRIILKKYAPNCIFCSGTEDVKIFKGKKVCASCAKELSE